MFSEWAYTALYKSDGMFIICFELPFMFNLQISQVSLPGCKIFSSLPFIHLFNFSELLPDKLIFYQTRSDGQIYFTTAEFDWLTSVYYSGSEKLHLAVLHPRKLAVYNVAGKHSWYFKLIQGTSNLFKIKKKVVVKLWLNNGMISQNFCYEIFLWKVKKFLYFYFCLLKSLVCFCCCCYFISYFSLFYFLQNCY